MESDQNIYEKRNVVLKTRYYHNDKGNQLIYCEKHGIAKDGEKKT